MLVDGKSGRLALAVAGVHLVEIAVRVSHPGDRVLIHRHRVGRCEAAGRAGTSQHCDLGERQRRRIELRQHARGVDRVDPATGLHADRIDVGRERNGCVGRARVAGLQDESAGLEARQGAVEGIERDGNGLLGPWLDGQGTRLSRVERESRICAGSEDNAGNLASGTSVIAQSHACRGRGVENDIAEIHARGRKGQRAADIDVGGKWNVDRRVLRIGDLEGEQGAPVVGRRRVGGMEGHGDVTLLARQEHETCLLCWGQHELRIATGGEAKPCDRTGADTNVRDPDR